MALDDDLSVLAWTSPLGREVHHALAWGTRHTGLPVVVVAAIVLVASVRIVRHAVRFALHVAVVAAFLALATHLGWVRW